MSAEQAAGHAAFSHDSISGLGFDWSRAGDPQVAPQPPLKVYLPRDTEDVARAVAEARRLGQELVPRGNGHSSNGATLGDHVISFHGMDRVLAIDPDTPSVTVQAGASLIAVDDLLGEQGLGLPVVGDHRHLTAGGFASVGGVSPASHLYGLFADNIAQLEYVTYDGDVKVCGRDLDSERFHRLLTGCGRHGLITTLTLDAIRIDKNAQLLANHRKVIGDLDAFIAHAERQMSSPDSARLQRGYWIDLPVLSGRARFGQWSDYRPTTSTQVRRWQRQATQTARSALGQGMSLLPDRVGKVAKMAGVSGVVFAPAIQSVRDAERGADTVLDYSVGDPTRWFAAWVPMDGYGSLFRRLTELYRGYRQRTGCFTFVGVLTQAIRSPYLTRRGGGTDEVYGAVMMICGVRPSKLTADVLDSLIEDTDAICVEEGALRYLHSPATANLALDPNLGALDLLTAEVAGSG